MNASGNLNPALSSTPQSYDAIVVGGGPAGLAAAIALSQRGVKTLVVEALQPPIDKACGEGLMPDSLKELRKLGVELSGGRELSGIRFTNRTANRDDLVTAEFPLARGLGIRRLELHQALIDRASEVGARIKWGTRGELGANGEVRVEGRLIPHRYLIGADGQASRVRSWAGLEAGSLRSQRLGFRRHYRFPANGLPLGGYVEVHWGPRGQAYLTPVGENEICIAAVTRQGGLNFDSIVDDLPHLKQALQGAQAIGRDRGAVTTTRKLRHVVRGNIALIGDASGSADAVTGEGLASAFREAHLLGEALGRDRIGDYEAGQSRILRLPQGMASVMLSMDRWPAWRNRAMRVLAGSPELFAAMLAVHIGENGAMNFAASHSWELLYRLIFPKSDAASRLPASHRTANDPNLSPHDTGLAYRQR